VPLRKYSGIANKSLQEAVLDFKGLVLRSCRETIKQVKMKLNKGIIIITSRMNINSMKEKRMVKIK